MATNLVYTVSPYIPFTKILSANINQDKTDIKNRINWDGVTNSTGLGDDNVQSNTVSGGGLTRSTKLKKGTAKAFVVNDSTGAMTEVTSAANQVLYTNTSGDPTAGQLPVQAGGTGLNIDPSLYNVGDVLQINPAKTGFVLDTPPAAPSLRVFNYHNFT